MTCVRMNCVKRWRTALNDMMEKNHPLNHLEHFSDPDTVQQSLWVHRADRKYNWSDKLIIPRKIHPAKHTCTLYVRLCNQCVILCIRHI